MSTFRGMILPFAVATGIAELIWYISAFWEGSRVLIRTTLRATTRNQNARTLNENSVNIRRPVRLNLVGTNRTWHIIDSMARTQKDSLLDLCMTKGFQFITTNLKAQVDSEGARPSILSGNDSVVQHQRPEFY
jgi:hypothetical protein